MANNTTLNAGTGGDVIATDDVAGVKYQRVKLTDGTEDSSAAVASGNGLAANALRVTVASDSTGVVNAAQSGTWTVNPGNTANTTAWKVDGSAVTQPVSGTVTANATLAAETTKVIGTVNIAAAQTLATVTTVSTVSAVSAVTPGTGASNLGKAEDAAHASGDVGVMALAVRKDSAAALAGADGDYIPLTTDANGALRVVGSSGTTQYAEDSAAASGDSLVAMGAVRQDTLASSTSADGDYSHVKASSTGAIYVNVAEGGIPGIAEDTASAGGETGVPILVVRRDAASSGVSADGDWANLSVDSNGALRVVGSSATTQYAEDAVAASGDLGVAMLAVRRDAATSGVSADGDYAVLSVTSDGSLRVAGSSGTTQYTEDGASVGGESLVLMGAVRRDTAASSSGTDGDYSTLNVDNLGRLHVNASGVAVPVTDNAGSLTVDNAGTFAVQAAQSGTWTVQPGNTANTTAWKVDGSAVTQPVSLAAGAAAIAKAEDVASADADVGVPAMAVRKATPANTSGTDGDYEMLQMSAGRLWVDASGVSLTVASHAVTNAGTFAVQESGTHIQADDAAFTPATSKVTMAGFTADDSATDSVDEGDGGAARMTLNRKQINQPYESEANSWNYAAAAGGLVNTTGVTAKAAAGAGLRNYITSVQVTNSHATTGTEVLIRDGASGTVLHRGWASALGGYSAQFPVPLRGTANTLVEIAEVTATATTGVLVNLQGYVGA